MTPDEKKVFEELKNDPKCQAYLSKYEPESALRFLEDYARQKDFLLSCGESLRDRQQSQNAYFREWAEYYYWRIAQKKLFNLECLWRAEKIDLPVKVAYELHYWQDNIKSCPFVAPVTDEEIHVMLEFIKESDCYYHYHFYESYDVNYADFKDKTGIGVTDYYPDWFAFYDTHIGPPDIMALPDIRGKKEDKYREVWFRSRREPRPSPPPSTAPKMGSFYSEVEDFIKNVEPYKILDYYRLSKKYSEESEFNETLDGIMKLLTDETETVTIPAGIFPDAIYAASMNLRVERMKILIPEIHREHTERVAMGITYELDGPIDEDDIVQIYRRSILEGRKLSGEPEDFDF